MRFDRGVRFYKAGAFEMALVEFRRAYELVANYRVLYNIGQACYQLHDFACAQNSFERYLADGGTELPEDRRTSVSAELTSLGSLVVRLRVLTEPGADVLVDDVLIGRAPLRDAIVLNPGRRKVTVSKVGLVPATKWVLAASGDRAEVRVELAPIDISPRNARPQTLSSVSPIVPVLPPPPTRDASALWIGWTGAGVLAGGALLTGWFALRASSDLQHDRGVVPVSRDTLDHDLSRASNLALATDILGGLALVTAGTTLYFTLRGRPETRQSPGSFSARLQPTAGGMTLTGAF